MSDAQQQAASESASDADIIIQAPGISVDLTTVGGLVGTFALIIAAILMGSSDANFINIPSILIVIFGTMTVTAIAYSGDELKGTLSILRKSFFVHRGDPRIMARQLMDIAMLARKKGFLILSQMETELRKDPQIAAAVRIVTDGYSGDDVERVLTQDIDSLVQRHRRAASILRRASEIAPAMGLIGTLIGLVQMLANMATPQAIGPAMAVALLTTFYGAIFGMAVLAPMAAKLERNSNDEVLTRVLILTAMTSIAHQENPRRLEMLLNSELPPDQRIDYFS